MPTDVFVGFASEPSTLADTIRSAAGRIGNMGGINVQTWEDLRIGGTLLIDQIETAIKKAKVSIFDMTHLNENVLFEVGYAIGSGKIIWPLRDYSDRSRQADWNSLEIFSPVGQIRFTNSDEILAQFISERPDLRGESLFENTLGPQLSPGRSPSLFYMTEVYQTDAGRAVLTLMQKLASSDLGIVTADKREASVQTLPWFTQHIYSAEVVVIHLMGAWRHEAPAHNARASFVAGLAHGMGKPVLMLAEQGYESALDYRELLFRYADAHECETRVEYWVQRHLQPVETLLAERRDAAEALKLSTELRSVYLGEYVAENEARDLPRYYVETASYREVLSGSSRVYSGQKGSGKSAAALRAEAALRSDARNLVCAIKPPGYDLDGLVRLLETFETRDAKGYVAESLWKYLLATQLALSVEEDLSRRPASVVPNDPEWALMNYVATNESWLKNDFSSRLDHAVSRLLEVPSKGSISARSERVSEALHSGPLRELRAVLGPALAARRQVFIIVDNLDKAWDRETDVLQLARLLLALLSCMDAFRSDLEKTAGRKGLSVSLSLFVRSDIFATVSALAREPDKLPVRRIRWPDDASLLDVVEERYRSSQQVDPPPGEMWTRYFCSSMGSVATTEWVLRTCLPRPRDVLFLLRAAIDHAVGARHNRVEVDDLRLAEREYSLFAFEAAIVEGQQRVPQMEGLLLSFAGVPSILAAGEVEEIVLGAGVDPDSKDGAIDVLQQLSFLGLLVRDGEVTFPDSPREKQKAEILAKRKSSGEGESLRYAIHPAFWAYLEMERSEGTVSLEF
jgi:hypothetical protein